MPAYNPPPQVLFSPVTNYYQGKAIRQQLAAGEQDMELKQAQIDSIPAQQAADAAKLKVAQDKAAREVAQELRAVDADKRAKLYEAGKASLAYFEENPDDEVGATEQFALAYGDGAQDIMPGGDSRISLQEAKTLVAAQDYESSDGKTTVLTLQEKLDMGMRQDWAASAVVERDETGNVTVTSQPTGLSAEDAASRGDPRTDSQRGAAYEANLGSYNTSTDVQEMISNALPQVIEMPGTVGIKGSIGQGGAGFLASLGQEEMSNAFAEYMSGASPEDIAQIQTQLQTIRGRIIPIVTGEQGKRLSETEREIASKAVGLIESIKGPADLTKSYPQVLGAMRQLYAESWATKYRIAQREGEFDYPYDLSDSDQRIELFTEFSDAGVDIDTAKRTMIRLKSIQGVE